MNPVESAAMADADPPTPNLTPASECPYVSRGGLKLAHALREFGIDVAGLTCADLGASTGGFTDCLLKHGAARVYAVDTAYGQFAWTLRNDPRVVVMERSNALHAPPPVDIAPHAEGGGVDLVVMDLGWTKQKFAIPAALRWLARAGRIITLVKPHYEQEQPASPRTRARAQEAVLAESAAIAIVDRVRDELPVFGVRVLATTRSPILGGSLSPTSKSKGSGNAEWLMLVERAV